MKLITAILLLCLQILSPYFLHKNRQRSKEKTRISTQAQHHFRENRKYYQFHFMFIEIIVDHMKHSCGAKRKKKTRKGVKNGKRVVVFSHRE